MEKTSGTVTELKGKNVAKVKIKRKQMCGENCASCGHICGGTETVILAENKVGAAVGDEVTVQIPEKKGFLAMLVTYGVPLLFCMIVVALMGILLPEQAGAGLLLGGVVLWFFILWLLEKKGVFVTMFKTEIIEIREKKS